MKIPAFIIGACALAGAALALPTTTDAASTIAGYLDPSTGSFTPAATQAQIAATAASVVTRKGTVTFHIKVAIESAIPTGQQISCSAGISSNDFGGVSNSANASSVLVKAGSTGTCTMAIPYQWLVASSKTMINVTSISVSTDSTIGSVNSRFASTSFPAFQIGSGGSKSITVSLSL